MREHQSVLPHPCVHSNLPEVAHDGLAMRVHGPSTVAVQATVLWRVAQLGRGAEMGGRRRRR